MKAFLLKKVVPLITVTFLYVLFTIGAVVASVAGLVALPFRKFEYISNILHALDCTCAALLGYKGDKTISKECASSDSRFCKSVCKFTHYMLECEHCKKQLSS